MNPLDTWDDETYRAMAHPTKRKIIECLQNEDLSFTELLNEVSESNHGRFGYHLRTLKGFVEPDPSTKKYHLTERGRLLGACIRDFRFISSAEKRPGRYAQGLGLGDHAVGFYDTEEFKRKISFPFLESGLKKGEAGVYIASENRLDSKRREIQRYRTMGDYLRNGALMIMSADEWYLRKGKAQAKKIIAHWVTLLKQKQKAGFTGLRSATEMETFFYNAKKKELLRYEAELGRHFDLNLSGLCLYNTDTFDEEDFARLCNCHGHLISKGIVGKTIV